MTKFKSVLSNEEIANIVFPCDWSGNKDQQMACLIARHVEQAVLTKRHEQQEPDYYFFKRNLHANDGGSHLNHGAKEHGMPLYAQPTPILEQEPFAWFIDDKRVCGSRIITDPVIAKDWLGMDIYKVVPLYARPTPALEQEPVAEIDSFGDTCNPVTGDLVRLEKGTKLYTHPCVSPVSHKTACVSESAESEDQDIELLKQALETMIRAAHPAYVQEDWLREKLIKARDTAFKALETNRLNAKERHRTAKNSLEQEVLCMVHMLEAKEWADHAGQSALGKRLEVAISTLHNELYEAQVKRSKPELARNQSCGCVVCHCENEDQCLGCGAKHCGTHEVGEIPNPIYADHIPDASKMVVCAQCGRPAIHYLVMDNLPNENKAPLCAVCTQEHEHLAQDTNEHEMRNFGGAYGLVTYHYEPLANHIPDAGQMINLSLSVDTKEAQTLLRSRLDSLDDWQLMPKKLTGEMLRSAISFIENAPDCMWIEYIGSLYDTLLAAAPKLMEGDK